MPDVDLISLARCAKEYTICISSTCNGRPKQCIRHAKGIHPPPRTTPCLTLKLLTNTLEIRSKMSSNKNYKLAKPGSRNEHNVDCTMQLSAKDEEHRMGHDVVVIGLRSAMLTYWLKFLGGALMGLLVAFLCDKFVGLPRRPCPPCEARAC